MKTFAFLFLLLLCGCASTSLDQYQAMTPTDINAKIKANNGTEGDKYNEWRYAGSDDKYDYIYEFKPGIFLSPPSNYHYYKLPKGELDVAGRYPFAPDIKKNTQIFEW
jgi:hypothetical protein